MKDPTKPKTKQQKNKNTNKKQTQSNCQELRAEIKRVDLNEKIKALQTHTQQKQQLNKLARTCRLKLLGRTAVRMRRPPS